MKNAVQSLCVAEVDVAKVKLRKGVDTGIEFSNSIDAWAKMQFRFSGQIRNSREDTRGNDATVFDLRPLHYSFRQKIDL